MKEINAVTLGNQVYPAVQGTGSTANTLKGKQSFDSFLNVGSNAITGSVKPDGARLQQQATGASSANAGKTQQADTIQAEQGDGIFSASDAGQTGTDVETSGVAKASEASEAAVAVNTAIKEAVKDITGLDDDALEEIMSMLGMSFADLLDMGNLKQFVMYINNTSDVTDLLMDESMMLQLNNLTDVIADIDIEAITGMPESDFAQLLQSIQDGSLPLDNSSAGQETGLQKETGLQQETVDIPVTVEYEEDVPAGQKEAAQTVTVTKETVNSQKETTAQEKDATEEGRLNAGSETKEDINKTGQNEGLKQGTDSQAGRTLADEVQAETKTVHEETSGSQTGFIQNLAQALPDVHNQPVTQQTNMQTMINIVNQVVEQIKVTMGKEATTMQLQLNPESLGKVLISVTSNHGVMTANFTVQSEEAKEALQSQMFSLREALESRNLKVDAVEVEVSDFAFSQSSQADAQDQKEFDKGNGKSHKSSFDGSGDDEADSGDMAVSGEQNTQRLDMGSSIDFTA